MKSQADIACDLVSRINAGDTLAETELFRQYASGVRIMLLKRTGNPQLSDDLCQEALIKTLNRLRTDGLQKPESLPAYIQNTAKYLHIQHFRKEKKYIQMEGGIISLVTALEDNKGGNLDRQRAGALLEELMEQLTVDRDREILRRFYFREQDKVVICNDLNLSPTRFDRVLYRERQRMRELIKENNELKSLLFGSLLDD